MDVYMCVDLRVYVYIYIYTSIGCMDGCMDVLIDVWVDVWRYGRMDVCMDGWMPDGCLFVCSCCCCVRHVVGILPCAQWDLGQP